MSLNTFLNDFVQTPNPIKKGLLVSLLAGTTLRLISTIKHTPPELLVALNSEDNQRNKSKGDDSKKKVAVDKVFFGRLKKIIKVAFPSWKSREAFNFFILSGLLCTRTVLSIIIAEMLGRNAQYLVSKNWGAMLNGILNFGLLCIPASYVNSALKYYTGIIALNTRVRLSEHVHLVYLEGTNFYKASNLGDNKIKNADQRVTADITQFSNELADLYTSLFKPLLDVLLFTQQLTNILGWQGPAIMYAYFVASGIVKRVIMPAFGKMVAKLSELEGYYRTAHQRLLANSEEIAFYDGSKKERKIINDALDSIRAYNKYFLYINSIINTFDSIFIKYYASIAGYCVLAAPLLFGTSKQQNLSTQELTRDYIRNSQYLGNLASAVGDLVLVGNKLTSIAGYTSRVSELLEMVSQLDKTGSKPFTVIPDKPSEDAEELAGIHDWIADWKSRCDKKKPIETVNKKTVFAGGGTIVIGDDIEFEHVDIVSPEGKLLVADLTFAVTRGFNVMVTGPNGCGKSSLFRVIGGLWPLHSGVLTKPPKEEILFVPQKPYLVLGTLRDQIIYPHTVTDMKRLGVTDEDLKQLLAIVDPQQKITTDWKFDEIRDWFYAFSGGQKQRVAMARLFYHRPKYAILDECTSAVSDEIEDKIYETCKELGITIFTVSHRKNLARHHDKVLHFDGRGKWEWLDIAPEYQRKPQKETTSSSEENK